MVKRSEDTSISKKDPKTFGKYDKLSWIIFNTEKPVNNMLVVRVWPVRTYVKSVPRIKTEVVSQELAIE